MKPNIPQAALLQLIKEKSGYSDRDAILLEQYYDGTHTQVIESDEDILLEDGTKFRVVIIICMHEPK